MAMYLLICCDTCWTTKFLRLPLYLKHVALPGSTVAVTPTVLTTVHGKVVSRAKLREAGITAKFMYHILVINFMSNLEWKNNNIQTSRNHQKLFFKHTTLDSSPQQSKKITYNSILLTHAAFGWNAISIYGNHRFSFQFIRWQTWLAAKIFTNGGIFKLGTDHILWI